VPKAGASEESAAAKAGLGPNSYEAYLQAMRTYPAKSLSPAIVRRAKLTFARIAKADARRIHRGRTFLWDGNKWKQYGPRVNATQPGVTSFSGATNNTASRTPMVVADPNCNAHKCRLWAGVSGGGVWMTENALAPDPVWKQMSPNDLDQNSVGDLVLVPGGKKHDDTLYLGTGEPNRCSSGCEAGVGIYRSTDNGEHWKKLDDTCVNNATYTCVNPGQDAFLGRAIAAIVVDPTDSKHILVGSAQAGRPATSRERTSPVSTSRGTAARPSPRSGTAQSLTRARPRSASTTSDSTRSTRGPSTCLPSTQACGDAIPGRRQRRSARSSHRSSTRVRASTGRCSP